ncbi:helix-turn-helix transcriptional regulator [Paenibacillus sp. PL91]|uniref:helix-turn-helix transcriptional regulator n=1 Tax=Paenibacillus sp. PL91 TaxID=2729538 RepID=UPI00145C43DC|nr:YafY family protein [Paenibacillus sp. PL91]MBC9201768.1 YafY family transcriptional regulator [Paenibacillus sp. PL91]
MSKADSMLSILWLLRSGRKMTARQLSDELEIHIRTVYRCIDSLCASGAPIMAESGPNGGFQIIGRFADTPLMFDSEEQKALMQASVFAEAAGYPFTEALSRAIDKLKLYTNEEQSEYLHRHSHGLSVISPPVASHKASILQELEEACARGQSIMIDYDKGRGSAVLREYDPYGIIHWKGSWYTVGFCRLRQSLRSFRVDRILRIMEAGNRFERPADFSSKDFLMGQLLPDSLGTEKLIAFRVRAHEQVLNELQRHWLFGHALVERSEEEALFQLGASSLLSYVPYFLLPYGKALTILEPSNLIEKLAEISSSLAAHYGAMLNPTTESKG